MKHLSKIILLFVLLLGLTVPVCAQEAEDITSQVQVDGSKNLGQTGWLFDGNMVQSYRVNSSVQLTLTREEGVGSLYFIFDDAYEPYTVTDVETGTSVTCGENGFLHDFVDLEQAFGKIPTKVQITMGELKTRITEIRVFGPGEVPDYVQRWKLPPEKEVDLLLFSAHGDDEQLFFSGLLPEYAGQRGYEVLVAYLTDHHNNGNLRCHEMLDGLWAVGVTNYPVFGAFPDYYTKELDDAYEIYKNNGYDQQMLLGYVVEQLRRYQPMVAVGHDVEGEYGHGMHRLYSDLLQKAVEISMDPEQFPETAEQYGVWDVPKTYLHMYPENPIVMDWDQPLSNFDGKTAFEVTRDLGFPAHHSQYWDFSWYSSPYVRASDIPMYGPCDYGLFRTTVGEDVQKNDFFENTQTHAEAKAEQERLEAERLEQERQEAERLEAERLEQEQKEKERQEAERIAEEKRIAASESEAAAASLEAQQQEEARRGGQVQLLIADLAIIMALILVLVVVIARRKMKKADEEDEI